MTAGSVSYGALADATVSGPTGPCAGHATCGTATVTTIAAGNVTGSLVATPSTGTAASQAVNITQVDPPPVVLTVGAPTVVQGNPQTATWVFSSSNPMAVAIMGVSSTATKPGTRPSLSGTCTTQSSIAANGTCTVVSSATQECSAYVITVTVTDPAGGTTTNGLSVPKPSGACN